MRRWLRGLRLRLRALTRRDRVEAELDEELRDHLERQVEVNLATGMSPTEARFAALRALGGIEQRKEECRDARGLVVLDNVRRDLRDAVRALRHTPAFTAVAVISLALGIGANTTIFTIVNAVLLRPLPYPHSERLVVLREQPRGSAQTVSVHPLNFLEWSARARSFEALALVQTLPINVLGDAGAEQVAALQTTSELFRVFAVQPALGRGLEVADTQPGHDGVAILGHAFWRQHFGGSPGVLGRRLVLSDGTLTIVGVAPPGLRIGTSDPDVYMPLVIDPAKPDSIGSRSFQCYGRLKAGIGLEAAGAEMAVVSAALSREYVLDEGYSASVARLDEYLVREGRPALRLLMAVVAVVLMIACVNLAGLLAARSLARRPELALRASLGASRGRLVSQMVIESLVLSAAGGVAGWLVATWAVRALVALTQGALTIGRAEPIGLDATCLLFTLGLSTVTALSFGLAPAWEAGRVEPQTALGERSRGGTASRRHHRMRSALVAGEVALAVILLVGAGLLLRTFARLTAVDLGFQPDQTITMGLFLGDREPAYRIAVVDRIIDRVEALHGVTAASTIQFLPLTGMNCGTGFWHEEQTPGDPSHALPTDCSIVSRGYFAAMGIPLVQGRAFDRRDRIDSPRVVVVNQSFARRYFPDGRALGRRIAVAGPDQTLAEIIAVARDIRHNGLTTEPVPTVFLLHAQTPGYITNLVVRTSGDPASQAVAIRRAVHDVDPTQAVSAVKTMGQYYADALARPRLYAVLVAAFAVLALVLAVTGIYGLLAYIVTERTHEIGIRLALGAARADVFRAMLGHGVRLAGAGLAVGLGAAWGLRRVVTSLLFGITASDATTYALAAGLFAIVVLLAAAIPAGRASRVDPLSALRYE